MCVSVWVTPGTRFSVPGMTLSSSSWARTRTMATRSNSPVTEETSLPGGIWATAPAVSGMRATSALTRTIAVTTSASSGADAQPSPVAYPPARGPTGDGPDDPADGPDQPGPGPGLPPGQILDGEHPAERADTGRGEPGQQAHEHIRGGERVRERTVPGRGLCPEELREGGQFAVGHLVLTEYPAGEFHRVHHRDVRPGQAAGPARGH